MRFATLRQAVPAIGLLVTMLSADAMAQKPTIVLVHGAFADASSFQYLIPILQKDGYHATTSEINASHVAFMSHPKVVAKLIEQAATATAK